MDRDMKNSVTKLERGVEVKDMERMHGDRIASSVLVNEEVEEKQDIIAKLQRRLGIWRAASILSLIMLILALLYMVVSVLLADKEEEVEPELPVAETIIQDVRDVDLVYVMDMPRVDLSQMESVSLEELVNGLTGVDFVDYLGKRYHTGDDVPSGVALYSMSDYEALVDNMERTYTLDGEPLEEGEIKKFVDIGCSVHNFGASGQELPSEFYFNASTVEFGGLNAKGLAPYTETNEIEFSITVYDGSDIKGIVGGSLDMDELVKTLSGVAFSLEAEDFSYSNCEVGEADGYITCNGNIPQEVVNYEVSVTLYDWNVWVLSSCSLYR